MSISEVVKRMFATDDTLPREYIAKTWLEVLETAEALKQQNAQRLLDWYDRDKEEILTYVKDDAKLIFGDDIETEWAFPILNGVPRTVKRLSQSYNVPPKRELVLNGEVIEKKDKAGEKYYDQFRRLYEHIEIDSKLKDVDRYATLLNTVHVEVVPRYSGIDWDIRLRPKVTVLEHPDNYLDFLRFAHKWEAKDPDNPSLQKKEGWIYWSEDEHFLLRNDRVKIGMTMEDFSIPYRDEKGETVIPICTLRKLEQQDYWGQLGEDLVDAVQAQNVQLAQLWNTVFKQTGSIPVLTNIDISSGAKLRLSPGRPLHSKNVTKDDVPPGIDFAKPDPDTEGVMKLVDWFIKSTGAGYGLPPSAWALEEKRMSGIAKFIDNLELLENREAETSIWEKFEKDLFKKSIIVYNQWAKQNRVEKIDSKLELKITFPPAQFPESPTERAQRLAAEFAAGINSPVEFYMQEEGLTEQEAMEKAVRIAKQNSEIRKAAGGTMPEFEEIEQ